MRCRCETPCTQRGALLPPLVAAAEPEPRLTREHLLCRKRSPRSTTSTCKNTPKSSRSSTTSFRPPSWRSLTTYSTSPASISRRTRPRRRHPSSRRRFCEVPQGSAIFQPLACSGRWATKSAALPYVKHKGYSGSASGGRRRWRGSPALPRPRGRNGQRRRARSQWLAATTYHYRLATN